MKMKMPDEIYIGESGRITIWPQVYDQIANKDVFTKYYHSNVVDALKDENEALKEELNEQIKVNNSTANRELGQINEISRLKAELTKSPSILEGYKLVPIKPTYNQRRVIENFMMVCGCDDLSKSLENMFYTKLINAAGAEE